MKVEGTNSVQMLHKGVVETAQSQFKEQEAARLKATLGQETKKTVSSFIENKGIRFDVKA